MKRSLSHPRVLRTAILWLVPALFFSSCSLPRIIVLHDPLSPDEHDNLGRIYEAQGKIDLARDQYQQALQKDRKHLLSLLLMGDLSYRTNDFTAAESAYEKALKIEPGNGDVRNNLAWVYIRTERKLDRAKELVTQALTLNPEHRPYYLDTLGFILLKLGSAGEAVTVLKESVDTLPKDRPELLSEARGHLADAYKLAGDETKYIETKALQNEQRN